MRCAGRSISRLGQAAWGRGPWLDGSVPDEKFRKHRLTDRVDSSAGYSIRLRRDRVEYTDEVGTVYIDAEWSPGRGVHIIAFTSNVPDGAHRRREGVVGNLARAFDSAGWRLTVRA